MITSALQLCIRARVGEIVEELREEDPALTPGEIYDAIARELERRCRAVIERRL